VFLFVHQALQEEIEAQGMQLKKAMDSALKMLQAIAPFMHFCNPCL